MKCREMGTVEDAISGHLPRGRCGLKLLGRAALKGSTASPSARKVWIEIEKGAGTETGDEGSPSARKVWIEIGEHPDVTEPVQSPSARKVWIEITFATVTSGIYSVTFREEGVD